MRNESHSLIGVIREHVIAWRKHEGWSREAVVQVIVEAHEKINGPIATGIVFDPPTRDAFERQRVNADRVFRWLDDQSKDNNLLPANFIPSIWAAMPMAVRLPCIGDCLRPLGVAVTSAEDAVAGAFDALPHLSALIKETSEAQLALVGVGQAADTAQLEKARKEVEDVCEVSGRTARALDAALSISRASTDRVVSITRTGT